MRNYTISILAVAALISGSGFAGAQEAPARPENKTRFEYVPETQKPPRRYDRPVQNDPMDIELNTLRQRLSRVEEDNEALRARVTEMEGKMNGVLEYLRREAGK